MKKYVYEFVCQDGTVVNHTTDGIFCNTSDDESIRLLIVSAKIIEEFEQEDPIVTQPFMPSDLLPEVVIDDAQTDLDQDQNNANEQEPAA